MTWGHLLQAPDVLPVVSGITITFTKIFIFLQTINFMNFGCFCVLFLFLLLAINNVCIVLNVYVLLNYATYDCTVVCLGQDTAIFF